MTLLERHSTHGAAALDPQAIAALLAQVPGWQAIDGTIAREYGFRDYRETIAFVNAVAAMAESENHHPELTVGYRRCLVAYTTHSAGGALSENDFICAAKADALYAQRPGA
ncbi:4a-hydroxytetrahydrobiopterin dehydratase [Massilia consociata]|uniref:Putative pterin-4-alpha-carbinolamine dehydratase n=1 Tax=Massilia consociata TaxID=760117 RepID=A0ABV6FGV8_9BURK